MLTSEALPSDLPWQPHAYLLLDGVSVKNLLAQAYQWFGTPDIQLLYATTPLAPCNELSPCLISLNGLHTPGLKHYFEHLAEEWGYLIFSHAGAFEVISHLRSLLSAQYAQGPNVWLRVADPAVMHAVLSHATNTQKPEVFGPMDRVVLPDVLNDTWQQHTRPGDAVRGLPAGPYVLCETQQALLDEVRFRASIRGLNEHLLEKFPGYRSELSGAARWQWLREVAIHAGELGFDSDQDLSLYANVFALLDDDALSLHPDIAALITQPSALTPSQRIEQAADLALSHSGYDEANQ